MSTASITWPDNPQPVATIPFPCGVTWISVSLTSWEGQLTLSLRDDKENVWLAFSSDGSNWSGIQNLSAQVTAVSTNIAPAVGALNDTLVVAYNESSSKGAFCTINTLVSFCNPDAAKIKDA